MARNYNKLDIEVFGRHLLKSGDLDPIYIALFRAKFPTDYLYRWLIAYWCFYSAGVACYLADFTGLSFWHQMGIAARNEEPTPFGERWPRGHERRHFRAKIAVDGVLGLQGRWLHSPERMVEYVAGNGSPRSFRDVSKRAQEHKGFGPWIGFKIADMVDRCLGLPVSFDNADVFMFDDPTAAALKLWRLKTGTPDTAKPKDQDAIIRNVVSYLVEEFKAHEAPPLGDRPVNVQEIETILCKWKSHMNGHYPLNNDIDEITAGVAPWVKHCQNAWEFNACMPTRLEGVQS